MVNRYMQFYKKLRNIVEAFKVRRVLITKKNYFEFATAERLKRLLIKRIQFLRKLYL